MQEVILNDKGGFEVLPIEGFEVQNTGGTVTMFPAGGDRLSGPGLIITVESFSSPVNLEIAVAGYIKNEPAYEFGNRKDTILGENEGRQLAFSTIYHSPDGIILEHPGASEGETIKGEVVIAVVKENRLFKCVMYAPEKEWDQYEPLFFDVLNSIHFLP